MKKLKNCQEQKSHYDSFCQKILMIVIQQEIKSYQISHFLSNSFGFSLKRLSNIYWSFILVLANQKLKRLKSCMINLQMHSFTMGLYQKDLNMRAHK